MLTALLLMTALVLMGLHDSRDADGHHEKPDVPQLLDEKAAHEELTAHGVIMDLPISI